MSDVELIRCTACRGTKKVAKLGGIVGDCNTCDGTGKIDIKDRPILCMDTLDVTDIGLIDSVARVKPNAVDEIESKPANDVIETKRKVFKRK